MPIYEYECANCGVLEVTQRITEDALTRCPKCKRRKVKKLISNTSFQLKGSGWYVTDYGGKKADDGSSGSSVSSDSSDSSAKSDSKSESKTGSDSKKKGSGGKKDGGKAKAA